MKSETPSVCRYTTLVLGWFISLVLIAGSVRAANPVQNPGFESSLSFGTVPWTVVHVLGGPADFAVKGRTTEARNGASGYGASFRPMHGGLVHAYFSQTVTGLVANGVYAITNWMCKPGDTNDAWQPKLHAYMETVGVSNNASGEATDTYRQFVITNTATANGQIEIRLHGETDGTSSDSEPPKWNYMHLWYDDVSMGLVSAPPPATNPPYKILSFTLAGPTASWTWQSISNRHYDIQASPDLSNWSTFHTNLLATGTNLTFTTNVSLVNPQFFRIRRP